MGETFATSEAEHMKYFLEIYGGLPRAGPGSHECTQRAWGLMTDVRDRPRILDLGCGPGAQTVDLLTLSNGTVVALDFLPLMIERTATLTAGAGLSDRLQLVEQDMREMAFPSSSFDVIWSEGAIYNLGFEDGLRKIRSFVRPGGYVAVSEPVWLKDDPPEQVVELWKQYPEIDTVSSKLDVIQRLGYEPVGHFVLPDTTWTSDYYDPMETVLARKETEWEGVAEAMRVIEEARIEIETFRKYSSYYGYAFFVMRRPGE